jgi:N-glycosylase/DNA lyase
MTAWSDWQPLSVAPPFTTATLAETLDGGQAFRWRRQPDGAWLGVWDDCAARLRFDGGARLEWSAPEGIAARVVTKLPRYLALEVDFAALTDALPWRSDAHLAPCLDAWRGLRLLRQPFGETLLSFLCSATKQIVQIKQMAEALAVRLGTEIAPGFRRLPSWVELAAADERELRACALGFRARFIRETAQWLAAHEGWLDETEQLTYAAARERLCTLPGVGGKIADCVLLFGAGRYEAFPVDVWIAKAMARRYGLDGWPLAHVAQFGRAQFGSAAGLAQQYLFASERGAARLKPAYRPSP